MATPPSPSSDNLPALPLPSELRLLLLQHSTALTSLSHHQSLLSSLSSILQARTAGNGQMNVDVSLGEGYSIQGVVPDTGNVYVSMGWEDVWLEMELEKARGFVGKKIGLLESKIKALDEPISKLKKDYALVAETLRTVLQPPPESHLEQQA